MSSTTDGAKCGATRFGTDEQCDRPAGHPGQHSKGRTLKWGGRMRLSPAPTARPLPAGKRLAPCSVPPLPASKFAHIPGQLAMDVFADDPNALIDPTAPKE
jgi:hypothetical protein